MWDIIVISSIVLAVLWLWKKGKQLDEKHF